MKYFSLQTNQLVKVLLVFFVAFGITNTLFAQALTGNKTVGTGKDYSTIAAAIADLNLNGVGSGGVTFKVDAGHTETFSSPTAGLVTATGTSTNPIVFIKEGVGANPEITAGVGTGTLDGIIIISGGDYITFDGIDVKESASNTTSTTQMEWGYAILKVSVTDASKNVTITNSTITMKTNFSSIYGIYIQNHTTASNSPLTITNITGRHENLSIKNNTINTSYNGIYEYGASNSSSYYNYYTSISGNTINDFKQYGIACAYLYYDTVENNTIKNANSTSAVYSIYTLSPLYYPIIRGNVIKDNSTSFINYGMYLNSAYYGLIEKNKIYNLTSTYTSSGAIYGIYINGSSNKFYNNAISKLTALNANVVEAIYGISIWGSSNIFYHNTVFLDCASSQPSFGSICVYAYYLYQFTLNNNLLINKSNGKAVALARSSSSNPTNYLAASNNNLFYAGTPGPSNLIFTDYTNSHSDLALYKTFMANRDQNSFTENILFESTDIASSDYLRPKVGVLSNAESTGGNLGVLDDLNDVNIRVFPQSGQVYDGGTAPDIGAVEFDGISTLPTGTKTVGTGKDFATIQAAIAYINSYGGAGRGGVTFEVDPGHTETFSSPTAGLITASGSSASTITFKKAAGVGANPLITSGVGTGSYDGIIIIYGGDYITFDGIDVKDNTANINVTTQMEWGYALLKTSATDGVKNTTIKNCTITLQYANTATKGIYMDNRNTSGGSFTITSTAGIHEKNLFQSNTINTAYTGIYIYGYSTLAYYDNDNTLDGNTIDNFKNYGIYCYYNSTDSIINNTIKNGTFTSTRYGLYKYYGTNSVLSGNVIKDISNTSSTLYGLYISTATNVIVRSNTIKSLSGVSTVYGMYYTSCTAPLIEKNKISTITTTYNSTTASNGIYLTGGTSAVLNNNAVAKIYAPSANTSSTTYCSVNGIYIQGHAELNHNTVYLDCPTGGGANFSSCAIYIYTLSAYNLLMRNNVFVNASTYASGTHIAFKRYNSSYWNYYNAASNNNLYYAGTPGVKNLICYASTTYQTLAAYMADASVSPKDSRASTENVAFASTNIDDVNFLQPNAATANTIESGGTVISGFSDDIYTLNSRATYPKTGQVNGGGWAPDLGAVEYDGTPAPGLGGNITVGTGKDYTTIAAAIADLNLNGVSNGEVVFLVDPGHTETFATPTAGVINATGGGNHFITFKKATGAGANPLITAAAGTGSLDGIIVINGGDYITFDGIDVQENSANTNATTQMEWGYAILKASATNAPKNVTIKNCSVTLNNSNTATCGIYINNHTTASNVQLTISNTTGRTDDVTLLNNTITNAFTGIYSYGSSISTYYNLRTTIQGNTISTFGSDGVYSNYENTLLVSGNTIKNGAHTGVMSGVNINNGTAPITIEKNRISDLSSSNSGLNSVVGINVNTLTTASKIMNNMVSNLAASVSTDENSVAGIYVNGVAEVYYNTVYLNCTSGGVGFGSNAIYANTDNNLTQRNNIFINASTTGKVVSYRRSSTTIGTYQTASNNNLFYAGTPGSNNLIYTDGTTDHQLIKPYKTAMVNRDENSNRGTISFLSTAIASANFLCPDPSVNSYAESTGLDISGVTDDIDNTNVRTGYPLSGQVNGGGQFPDIGAVEYDGKGLPPLSGTFTVGTGEDYETLREAIIDLNLHGVTSPGITFNVKAGHTETFTSSTAGQINVSGSSSAPIVFQKDGVGANPLITSGTGVGSLDGIIVINGGDYITFDGIDVKDNVANVNNTTRMEWGYALLKPSATNGVKNVLIKNSTITLQYSNTSTRGIYMDNRNTSGGTHIISTSEGKHQDNTIQNNTIKTAYIGIYLNGYSALDYFDSNIVVTGNTVDDFKSHGIYSYYQHQNTITQNVVKNASFTSQVYGIWVYGREIDILRNKISGLSTTYTSSFATYGIYAGGPSPSGTLKIHNNMIANLAAPSSTNVSAVNGIYTSFYGTSEVYYNTVYLNCTSGGVGFGSNAFYISYTSYYSKIRNNIFVNASTYGTAVAQRHSSSSVLSYYDATSNNNLYYAGTPGSSNLIFANGTNYQTLTNFKGLVLPKDGNSRTENITLLSTDITNVNFLKPDPTIASVIESGAKEIAGVTDDNANANIRTGYPLIGQVNGGGTAPDMGAVEFDGTPMPAFSGTKTVGTGKDYATIEAAIDELNNKNIGTGGVTFKVDAGHTETFSSPTAGLITNTGTASKPIVFQKDGVGANPIITSGIGVGSYDGIIIINGGDYITFDGIDVKDNVANVTSTTQMEWGYALLKPSATDGVKNVLIKNSTITLQYANTSTRGIYMNNHNTSGSSHTISTSEGKHQDNTIQNNTINTAYIGIYLYGYSTVDYYDSNVVVTGNTVDDFKQYGIFSYYQHQNTIAQNVIKNASFTSSVYGIYVYGREVDILRNKISGLSTTYTSSFATSGIYASGPSPSGTLKIHNNMVANLAAPSSTNVSAVNGIYTSFYGTSEVYYNTVYLNCTSGGVGFGSNGLYITYTGGYYSKIRNNIFVNSSTYGTAVAQRHSSSSVLSYYDATSNNNLYYAGTPGSSNLIFANGTNYQTLANFQAIVSPRDANSKTENVTLLSTDITNVNFLKPDPTITSTIESGAEEIAGVTDDNANANIRTGYPLTGQVNGGGDAPDMGAVESDGTPIPPLVGIKTVGTGKDYSTIEAAIADLNSKNIGTGGVTFKVDAGHTETFSSPTAGLITKTGTAAKPIIFQKDGVGANPIITSGTGVGSYDGIIILHGTDYITFDGIDVRDNVANVNNTTRMEWGYALLKTSGTNGVSNATIKNCTITLQSANTNTRGILINNQNINGGSISVSALTGIHQNNTIKNNTINTAFIGIYLYGQSAVAYNDSNNLVSGNTIDDFEQYGIYSYYQKYDTIYNNTIKNATYTSTLYGVYKWYGTNSVIAQNTIRDLSTSSSGTIHGIYIYSSPQINVTGNILKDYSGVSQVFGISASYTVSPIIEKNRISRFTTTYTSFPAVNGISIEYGNTFSKIINNTISNLNAPNASGYYYIVNGIYLNSDAEVYHNTVYLACTTGGAGTFWTNGVYANTSYNLTMRNNVLINKSTYGTAVAFALSGSDKSKYSTSSNNNLFYSGTPSSTKLVYSHTGNTSYQTLANYKTYIASADANSLSGDITFLSTDIDNANFLHPDPSVQLLVESTGQKITGVDDDMDAVGSRITYPKVGQLNGGGWAPDLGAVEYDGTPMPGLGGTKTVGTGKDYATIEAAISALNTIGAAPGGVIFAVDAGHTETFTTATAGVIESGGASDRLVTFRKEGVGANPLITAPEGVGALDGIIVFNGSDYVVIDGIDVQEDNTNNTDDTKRMEWGYAILKKDATDGAKNITIKNCTITLNKTSGNTTYGIYINNHTPSSLTPLSISNASGQTDYVTTENNSITNVYNGLYSLGHTSYTNTYLNVKGNTINDYIQYGIYLQNEYNDSIHRNTIKNASSTTTAFGIYTTSVNTLIAQRNKISGLSTSSASDAVYGIYINGGPNTKLYHNRITSLTANSSTNANAVNGIYLMGNTDVIYNSVVLSCSAGGTGFGSNALYANTSYSISVKNNIFINNSSVGTSVAHKRSSTNNTNYSASSDNNLWYAGTPSLNNLLFTNGTNNLQTMLDYQNYFGFELASRSGAVSFVSTDITNPSYLYPVTASDIVESGAQEISNVKDDGDNTNIRTGYPLSGQSNGGGSLPDIGAIEFDGTPLTPLSGIKTVGTGKDYTTVQKAIVALNMYGVGSGGVTFKVDAGHTETFTSNYGGLIYVTGTASNPIEFKKEGTGANPLITAAKGLGSTDGIIIISGGDYITFDGIDVIENVLNASSVDCMEFGFLLAKANETNGPKNITIKNLSITLNNTYFTAVSGIYNSNINKDGQSITVTSNAGKTENILIQNTSISNVTYGVYVNGNNFTYRENNILIKNNTISNFETTGIYAYYSDNTNTVGNTIENGVSNSYLTGIYNGWGTNYVIEKNTITNLASSATSGSHIVRGIQGDYSMSSTIIKNNIISNLTAPNATNIDAIDGIYTYGDNECYNNTVFLYCASGGIGFGSNAFYVSYTPAFSTKLRNNIFINASTYGRVVAYNRNGTTLSTYLSPSDYNLFYAGTPSANNLIFYDGTNSDQTLGDYKTRMATRDQNSYTGMVNFITGDSLRPIAADYKNGTTISGVTEDIVGTARKATPNIGAYEGYPANYWVGVTSTDPTGRSNWGDSTVPVGSFPLTVDSLALFSPNMLSNWSLTNLILPAGKTLSLNGFNLSISGTITGAGKLVGNALSSVTITGTGNLGNLYFDQTTPGTTNRIKDFTLNRGTNKLNGGAVLGNTMEVTGTLTATTGTLNANGNLVLVSNVSGTARIAQLPATGDVTGNVTAQRYIPAVARRYRMIASPLQNFTFSQLADNMFVTGPGGISNGFDASNNNSPSIFTYQEANPGRGWKGLTNITNTLDDAMGSFVFVRGDRTLVNWYNAPYPSQNILTIDFSGQPINKGTYAPNLTYTNTGTPGDDGWNLVGNPYPSQIDWTALSSTNLSSFYYMYNPATGSYESDNGTKYIAMGQAFFVQATGSSPTLVFYESSKTASAPTNYFKTGNSILNARMVKDSLNSDLLTIRFVQGSSVNYHPTEDAIKFTNSTINFASLTNNDSIKLQHNIMPEPSVAYDTVKLYADAPNGSYSLEFSNLASIDLKYHVLLLDKYTNTTTNLRTTPSYTFSISANAATKGSERFAVIFANQSALPVNLVAFSGSKQQQNAELEWNTASEKNTSHFVVERSMDGKEWEKAGVVASQGATAGSKYSYTDANVFAKAQQWYYRLQIVDRDKTNSYSKIIRIEDQTQAAEAVTSIYPIPTQGELYIETAGTASAGKVEITDAMGKLVLSKEYTKTGKTIALAIDHLEMGVYMLKYTEDGKVTVRKIIKR